MYEQFFGLAAPPFQQTPDSRFYFESRMHKRALLHLTFGLAQAEGFVVVTGEVGAGKTTLIERLCGQLPRGTHTLARINTTQLTGDDLFRLTLASFGMTIDGIDKPSLLLQFSTMLRDQRRAGRRCVLVVDEVQNLPLPALEELRMLSNIAEDGRPLLQTVLLGQPQFRRALASPELDQLRQRVIASFHLGPMSLEDTRAYVLHRLGTAGWVANPAWDDDSFVAIHHHSDGVPRRINRLCGRVLLYAALEELHRVTTDMVDITADELAEDLKGGQPSGAALIPEVAPEHASLAERVAALEAQVAHREWVFRRAADAPAHGQ